MEFKIRETVRYLGYKNGVCDEQTLFLINELMAELESACMPKFTYKIVDISIEGEEINFGFFKCTSKNLSKNLKNCNKAVIFAASLGREADFLIRRYSKTSITKSVIINACASSLIEDFCNISQDKIEKNGHFRPRFSPGYGDFSLNHQIDIVKALNTAKAIGLTLSDSLILMPTKSVTAVIGISETDENCVLSGCEVCDKFDCSYRR